MGSDIADAASQVLVNLSALLNISAATVTAVSLGGDPSSRMALLLRASYPWLVLNMSLVLGVAVIGNMIILCCSLWLKRPVTPNLKLCLSLAAADLWAAVLMLAGLFVNSFLAKVVGLDGKGLRCHTLLLELFRVSSMLSSTWHLFAVACNHYLGIFHPLKYKIWVTPRRFRIMMCGLWFAPLLLNTVYYLAQQTEWQLTNCNHQFYFMFQYRLLIFVLFTGPLAATAVIYAAVMGKLTEVKQEYGMSHNLLVRRSYSQRPSTSHNRTSGQWGSTVQSQVGNVSLLSSSDTPSTRDGSDVRERRRLQRRLRSVATTALIAGTFVVAWLPCVSLFVAVCYTCPLIFGEDVNQLTQLVLASVFNLLVMLKLALNPFLYAFRISHIQMALVEMKRTVIAIVTLQRLSQDPQQQRGLLERERHYSTRRYNYSTYGGAPSSRLSTRNRPSGSFALRELSQRNTSLSSFNAVVEGVTHADVLQGCTLMKRQTKKISMVVNLSKVSEVTEEATSNSKNGNAKK